MTALERLEVGVVGEQAQLADRSVQHMIDQPAGCDSRCSWHADEDTRRLTAVNGAASPFRVRDFHPIRVDTAFIEPGRPSPRGTCPRTVEASTLPVAAVPTLHEHPVEWRRAGYLTGSISDWNQCMTFSPSDFRPSGVIVLGVPLDLVGPDDQHLLEGVLDVLGGVVVGDLEPLDGVALLAILQPQRSRRAGGQPEVGGLALEELSRPASGYRRRRRPGPP